MTIGSDRKGSLTAGNRWREPQQDQSNQYQQAHDLLLVVCEQAPSRVLTGQGDKKNRYENACDDSLAQIWRAGFPFVFCVTHDREFVAMCWRPQRLITLSAFQKDRKSTRLNSSH